MKEVKFQFCEAVLGTYKGVLDEGSRALYVSFETLEEMDENGIFEDFANVSLNRDLCVIEELNGNTTKLQAKKIGNIQVFDLTEYVRLQDLELIEFDNEDKHYLVTYAVYEDCSIRGEEQREIVASCELDAEQKAEQLARKLEECATIEDSRADWWFDVEDIEEL